MLFDIQISVLMSMNVKRDKKNCGFSLVFFGFFLFPWFLFGLTVLFATFSNHIVNLSEVVKHFIIPLPFLSLLQ